MSFTLRLSRAAQGDIAGILNWSRDHFGAAARVAYAGLIAAALGDIVSEPDRPGSMARPQLGPGARSWHIRLSRRRSSASRPIRRPRHVIFYRTDGERVIVERILHEAMDLERHRSDDLEAGVESV